MCAPFLTLAGLLAGGEWSEDALQELKQLTLCGTWKVVMVKIWDKEGETPAIKIVDTTTDKVGCYRDSP